MKLKKMEKHDLAAYSIAINSDREMKRSVLVPMAPPYQKVTDYLVSLYGPKDSRNTQKAQSATSKNYQKENSNKQRKKSFIARPRVNSLMTSEQDSTGDNTTIPSTYQFSLQ